MWLYLKSETDFFAAPYRLLHIAPEQCFHERFRKMKNLDYVTGDINSPIADHHFDLHDIPFPENSFDVIFCNHVLEHVRDDHRCMQELHRVLRPGGWAIMQVPVDYSRAETLEDPTLTTPEEREKYYWQKDHVRLYGRDYPQRLTQAGFSVEQNTLASQLSEAERYRLQRKEVLYVCRK
jgi:SAM-dependent methyltransferase